LWISSQLCVPIRGTVAAKAHAVREAKEIKR
jgi:hypothetical protein